MCTVFVHWEAVRTTSVIQGLCGLDLPVGAQMAYKANICALKCLRQLVDRGWQEHLVEGCCFM